ncbi:MAG TPA: YfiR family protein [Cellvibrionaceae bacterium]
MWIKWIVKSVVIGILAVYTCLYAWADDSSLPLYEQKIKAGLVYNLLKYTEWPRLSTTADTQNTDNRAGETLHICVLGDDPFDGYLSPLAGRTAQQAIISIAHVTQIQQTGGCKVVIIHRSQEFQLPQLLSFLQGKNILTISDMTQFAEHGGMVELTRQNEKISLHINTESLNSARLAIDERMLKLAKIISNKKGV